METISKVQQKYKGIRRIERRPLAPRKNRTSYPENYVHHVRLRGIKYYKLIYQK